MTTKPSSSGGLDGIIAGESKISTVGLGFGLNYRGYNIEDSKRGGRKRGDIQGGRILRRSDQRHERRRAAYDIEYGR